MVEGRSDGGEVAVEEDCVEDACSGKECVSSVLLFILRSTSEDAETREVRDIKMYLSRYRGRSVDQRRPPERILGVY